jgi:GSH-dependent disulfide-bond oxidoreductase
LNPNSKIPAAVDYNGPNGQKIVLFESGSIVLYLAEKYKKFIPSDLKLRAEVMSWMFWQVIITLFVFDISIVSQLDSEDYLRFI